jgi:hypothetical protein
MVKLLFKYKRERIYNSVMGIIDSVSYGEIVIQGKTYYSDMVLWWNGENALLEKTHIIDTPLLEKILKKGPDSVVVGTGIKGTVKILPGVREKLEKRHVKLFVDKTGNAAEIYNGLVACGKRPAAVMHVTL